MSDTRAVHRAFVYVLDPTPSQMMALHSHCGGARFAYNHMLSVVKANIGQRNAERSYGVPEDQLTPKVEWSHYTLRKEWNAVKGTVAPWWSGNSKEAYSNALAGLASALKNWNDSRKGVRRGRSVNFPTFHKKNTHKSFTITTGTMRVEPSRHHITLPVIGTLHTMESTRKLARLVDGGKARVLRATVSEHRGRWQVSLLAEVAIPVREARNGSVVGVDVGVKDWIIAADSSGREVLRVPVPKQLAELDAKKRKLQRRNRNRHAPRKGAAPSNRWRKAQRRINKCDWRMAAIREDTLHKATTELSARFNTVVIEDLNVAGMMTRGGAYKKGLNRAIARSGMSVSRIQLEYKSLNVVKVSRWFPSSKLCSACGAVKAKLLLSERTYHCSHCGHTMDRDLNAAVNLAKSAGSPLVTARGAERKTNVPSGAAAAGVEARTPVPGESSRGNTGMQLVAI